MLKKEKIRLMTKLARYESGEGKEELRIARYYRSDYIGLALFRNFFLASIGYLVILLLVGAYFAEFLADHLHTLNVTWIGMMIVGGDDWCVFRGYLHAAYDPVRKSPKRSSRL